MKIILSIILLLCHLTSQAKTYDECTDDAWEEYGVCSDKCKGNLMCQAKCVETKNSDLKACLVAATKDFKQSKNKKGPKCISERGDPQTGAYFLANSCSIPQTVVVAWYSISGTYTALQERVTYKLNGNEVRQVRLRTGKYQIESQEEMKPITGGNAMGQITVEKTERDEIYYAWFHNTSHRPIAFTFRILSTATIQVTPYVLGPSKNWPLYANSETNPPWSVVVTGAEFEPD